MKVRRETSLVWYLLSYVKYLRYDDDDDDTDTISSCSFLSIAIGVGIITKIGSSVKNLKVGDRVGKKERQFMLNAHIIYVYHISYVLFSYSRSYT